MECKHACTRMRHCCPNSAPPATITMPPAAAAGTGDDPVSDGGGGPHRAQPQLCAAGQPAAPVRGAACSGEASSNLAWCKAQTAVCLVLVLCCTPQRHARPAACHVLHHSPLAPHPLPPLVCPSYEVLVKPRSKAARRKLRDISADCIGALVTFKGIVTQVSDVRPLLTVATYLDDQTGFEIYQEVRAAGDGVGFGAAQAPAANVRMSACAHVQL